MRKYFIAKDEAERDDALQRIKALGYTWYSGRIIGHEAPYTLSVGYDSSDNGITENWEKEHGKQTTIARFLIDLEIEKLKAKKRALPKLGEEQDGQV